MCYACQIFGDDITCQNLQQEEEEYRDELYKDGEYEYEYIDYESACGLGELIREPIKRAPGR